MIEITKPSIYHQNSKSPKWNPSINIQIFKIKWIKEGSCCTQEAKNQSHSSKGVNAELGDNASLGEYLARAMRKFEERP